jgi:uncharacterized protein
MAAGVPDRVDCVRLAGESAVLEREYALAELPRLQDVLARSEGLLRARFAFGRAADGRACARIEVQALPRLVCQRCLQGFEYPVSSSSEVEFSEDEAQADADAADHEQYSAPAGMLSLRELAEEEFLLALPIVAACATPERCGRAPGATPVPEDDASRRPFADLRNLMKKT